MASFDSLTQLAQSSFSGNNTAQNILGTVQTVLDGGSTLYGTANRAITRMMDIVAGNVFDGEVGVGRKDLATMINKQLGITANQQSPDVNGYTFIVMLPPDLSGMSDPKARDSIQRICDNTPFFALDITPPNITINTEEINTQASVSMPYATAKVATGQLSVNYIDNASMDVNSLHNVWIEYIYNQLWGDFSPSQKYWDSSGVNADYAGTLDYAASMFILKYDPSLTDPPVMVGKATGIFPLGLPVKETIGVRSARELVMENITYTCSYYEVIHPRASIRTFSKSGDAQRSTILDEAYAAVEKNFSKQSPSMEDMVQSVGAAVSAINNVNRVMKDPNSSIFAKASAGLGAAVATLETGQVASRAVETSGAGVKKTADGMLIPNPTLSRPVSKSKRIAQQGIIAGHTAIANSNATADNAAKISALASGNSNMESFLTDARAALDGHNDTQANIMRNSIDDSLKHINESKQIQGGRLSDAEKATKMQQLMNDSIKSIDDSSAALSSSSSTTKAFATLTNAFSSIPSDITINSVSGLPAGTPAGTSPSSLDSAFISMYTSAQSALGSISEGSTSLPTGSGSASTSSSAQQQNQNMFFGLAQADALITDAMSQSTSQSLSPAAKLDTLANGTAKAANILDAAQKNTTLLASASEASNSLSAISSEVTPQLGSDPSLKGPLESVNKSNGLLQNWQDSAASVMTAKTPTIDASTPVKLGSMSSADNSSGMFDLLGVIEEFIAMAKSELDAASQQNPIA